MHTPRSREICMHKLVSRRVGCAHASFQARTDGCHLKQFFLVLGTAAGLVAWENDVTDMLLLSD